MLEIIENVLAFLSLAGFVAFLAFKEYVAYRLPASHRLNRLFNPPKTERFSGASESAWSKEHIKGDVPLHSGFGDMKRAT